MRNDIWENLISLNSHEDAEFECLGPVTEYLDQNKGFDLGRESMDLPSVTARDNYPLPATADREGYYGPNHFNYWASGLRDSHHLVDCAQYHGQEIRNYLDMGCASGRVVRHMALQHENIEVYGFDINKRHVDWVNHFLPESIVAIQSHSIPYLPFPDNSIDMISAFSVFTHIECFDTNWLMEIRRILRPGGLAWLTVHTDKTWEEMQEGWPLYKGLANHPDYKALKNNKKMPSPHLVFRWHSDRSYSSNTFYSFEYIERVWSRVMKILEIRRRFPAFQDVIILQK